MQSVKRYLFNVTGLKQKRFLCKINIKIGRGDVYMFTREMIDGFSELDMAIYSCIINNKYQIANMTIKQLANQSHVSTGTVIKFCKKIGCEGYSEFKLKYKDWMCQNREVIMTESGNELQTLIARINSPDFSKSVEKAYELLKNAESTIFIGIGTSGILGKYGARFFSNVGQFSLFIDDPWHPVLKNMNENTVIIALSESGETPETIALAEQMKQRGSKLITITNNSRSVLAKIADCNISYHVTELYAGGGNITTQIPVIYILENIAKKIYMNVKDGAHEEENAV